MTQSSPITMNLNEFNQKHEFYPKMKWTFGIQANLDAMNHLSWHNIKYSNLWTQELPENHTQCNKTNVEIQILYLECQWKPHKSIIFLWYWYEQIL